jgi:LPXTG-motif cell wall-anchored protein
LRRALAAALMSLLIASGVTLGMTAIAHASSGDTSEEVSPEEYPPPAAPEETVEPKAPVEQALPKTGVGFSWPLLAGGGAALIIIGGGLLLIRRRA